MRPIELRMFRYTNKLDDTLRSEVILYLFKDNVTSSVVVFAKTNKII